MASRGERAPCPSLNEPLHIRIYECTVYYPFITYVCMYVPKLNIECIH